jgi:hypothetical protein
MKRTIFFLLATLAILQLSGCAHRYTLKENWIDDDDLISVVSAPKISKWSKNIGTPVFTEIRQDTVEFIYNYKPHLYKTADNGRIFKPNDRDRVDLWNDRTEYVGIVVLHGQIIQVRPRPDYAATKQVEAADSFPYWIIGTIVGVASLVVSIILYSSL